MCIFVYRERPLKQAALTCPLLNLPSLMGSVWLKRAGGEGEECPSLLHQRQWEEPGRDLSAATQSSSAAVARQAGCILHTGILQNRKGSATASKAGYMRKHAWGGRWSQSCLYLSLYTSLLPSLSTPVRVVKHAEFETLCCKKWPII